MIIKNISVKFISSLIFSLTMLGCGKVEEIDRTIQDVKVIKEKLGQAEQAKQQAEEQLKKHLKEKQQAEDQLKKQLKDIEDEQKHARQVEKESAGFTQIIKWIVWISGIFGLLLLLFSPLRNLFQRVLFKTLIYKPRRFNEDNE